MAPSLKALAAATAAGAAALGAARPAEAASFEEIVAFVGVQNTSWAAEVPKRFAEVEEVRRLCGTVLKGDPAYKEADEVKAFDEEWADDIPAEFDVRKKWPQCANVSGHIRDQSDCGSCWAFATTEAFNDRRCIAMGDTTLLSPEDTLSNCGFRSCFSMGCNGGQPGQAWRWFRHVGVVTGGDFVDIGKGSTCAPYPLKPCAHHTDPSKAFPKCQSGEEPTPRLGQQCSEKSYPKSYKEDKKRVHTSYSLHGVKAIQRDMLKYGSATAAFTVYEDFPAYKSGVYQRTSHRALGGHAVKLIGWGTEDGLDYWLVANSWNTMWGDQGTFKILRGRNECGIELQVSAGIVEIEPESLDAGAVDAEQPLVV